MHDFSGMADAGGMGYPPSPLIGPWPRVFGCGAGGNALGDMQFAGTGTVTGNSPERRTPQTPSDGLI